MDKYSENNQFEICPYNVSHRVQAGMRFQRHLTYCRQNHPNEEEVVCKFNYQHRIKRPEYKYHLLHCPDSHFVKSQVAYVTRQPEFVPPLLPLTTEIEPGNEIGQHENWDEELLAQPMQIPDLSKNVNLQFLNADNLSGLKRAQKREIRNKFYDNVNDPARIAALQTVVAPKLITKLPHRALLRKLPLPKAESQVSQLLLNNAGRGRGIGNANRIAANIFGEADDSTGLNNLNPMDAAGFGRGSPAYQSARSQLRPPKVPHSSKDSMTATTSNSVEELTAVTTQRFSEMNLSGLDKKSPYSRGLGNNLRFIRGRGLSFGFGSSQMTGMPKGLSSENN